MDINVQSPRLTESEKGILVGYHLSGYNVTEISQILRRTRATIYKWIKRYQDEGYEGLKVRRRSGRPRETNEDCDQRMIAAGNNYFILLIAVILT
jgi:transposase